MKVSGPTGEWTDEGEILNAFDAEALAKWFEALASRRKHDRHIGFTEPDFSFRIEDEFDETVVLRIDFVLRGRPPWARSEFPEDDDVWIELNLNPRDFEAAAASLRSEFASIQLGGK